MRKYLIFEYNSDIIMARILSEEVDDRLLFVNSKGNKFHPVRYKIGEFVYPLYNYLIDADHILKRVSLAREVVEAKVALPEPDGYRMMSFEEAKEIIKEYESNLKKVKKQYYIDPKTGGIMHKELGARWADPVTYPFSLNTNDDAPYVLEFDDDTDNSAMLWAEMKKGDYKLSHGKSWW